MVYHVLATTPRHEPSARRHCGSAVARFLLLAVSNVWFLVPWTFHRPFTTRRSASIVRWFPNRSSRRAVRWGLSVSHLLASSILPAAAAAATATAGGTVPEEQGAHPTKKRGLSPGSPKSVKSSSSDSQDSLDDDDDDDDDDEIGTDSGRGLVEDDSGNVWLRYVDGQGHYQLYRVPSWVSDLPLDRSQRIREAMNALLEDTLDDIERLLAHLEALGGKDGVDLESDDFVIDDDEDDDAVALSVFHEFFEDDEPDGDEVDDGNDEDDNEDENDEEYVITEEDDDDDHIGNFGSNSASADDDEDDEAEQNTISHEDYDDGDRMRPKKMVREPLARVVQFADYSDDQDEYDSYFRDPADWIDSDPTYRRELDALTSFFDEVKGSSAPDLQSRFLWLQRDRDYCSWGGVVCGVRPTNRTNTNSTEDEAIETQPVVIRIELPRAGLTGTFPASVVDFAYLEVLNLANNRLEGTIPSTTYENLTRLCVLDLSHNQLTGTIPLFQLLHGHHPNATVHNASSVLEDLRLSFNDFTGTLSPPAAMWTTSKAPSRSSKSSTTASEPLGASASVLSPLRWLDVTANRLSGTLPPELGRLTCLEALLLGDNWFSGVVPDLRNASSLRDVDVGANVLNSTASSLIESLPTRVRQVNAGHNLLHGTLSTDLWRLRRLELLILSDNQIRGTLPTSKTTIAGIREDAGGSKDTVVTMDGSATPFHNKSLQSHSYNSLKKLRLWWVARNEIRGGLPAELFVGLQSQLESLDISDNAFDGTIPTEIGLLTNLYHIAGEGNRLRGSLPNEMLNMNRNLRLNFTNNLLTGTIPAMFCGEGQATSSMLYQEFGCDAVLCRPGTFSVYGHATLYSACRPCPSEVDSNVSSSVVIDDKNPPLSAILGRTSCNGVEFVHGDLNGDGEVSPREVLRMLYVDTLGRFWGPDYRTWADMKVPECSLTGVTCANGQIVKIDLGSASLCSDGDRKPAPLIFCKGLPRELGLLATLEYLHLQRQKFLRGTLPSEVGQLRELRVLDLTGCSSIVSTLPTELGMLTNLVSMKITGTKFYGRIPPELFQLPNLSVIHLSNNHFTGTIPPMRLPSVKELLISRNDLTGSIPSYLTPLARLENFEAYHNKLTGRIPSQMGDCSSLKRIDLFGNKLTGQLPTSLTHLMSLQILHLKENRLTGIVPDLGHNPMLSWVDLSLNYLLGPIPSSFGASQVIEDLRLGHNLIHDPIPPGLCSNSRLNGGGGAAAAAASSSSAGTSRSASNPPGSSSCDHVLCPIGTYSEAGYATESSPCQKCPPGQTTLYLGSSRHACHVVTPERIMSILFEAMNGGSWPHAFQENWGDESVPLCRWAGLACDDKDEVMSIAFPLRGTDDYLFYHQLSE